MNIICEDLRRNDVWRNNSIFPTIPDFQNGGGKCRTQGCRKSANKVWHWPWFVRPVLSSGSNLLQFLLSSYITHDKDERKRKLALHWLQKDDSIHITNKTVENYIKWICISRQFDRAPIAQLVDYRVVMQVVSSTPAGPTLRVLESAAFAIALANG